MDHEFGDEHRCENYRYVDHRLHHICDYHGDYNCSPKDEQHYWYEQLYGKHCERNLQCDPQQPDSYDHSQLDCPD